MPSTVFLPAQLPNLTLLACAISAGFLFLTGSHIPKYVILILCFLTFCFFIKTTQGNIKNLCIATKEFFAPWCPWFFSIIVLVLFFNGVPEYKESLNALLLMFSVFFALYPQRFNRAKVISYLAFSILLASVCINIQIVTLGFVDGPNVIGTNKNKVLGVMSVLTSCCIGALIFEGSSYSNRVKLLIIASTISSLIAIILSEVRTAILPFLAMTPIICILFKKNKRALISILGIAILLLFLSFATGRMQQGVVDLQEYTSGNANTSWGIRLELWKLACKAFFDSPLVGWGAQPYQAMVEAGHGVCFENFRVYHFHSDYFNILAVGGLFGIISWFFTIFFLVKQNLKDPTILCFIIGFLAVGLTEVYWFTRITLFALVTTWTLLYISKPRTTSSHPTKF